MRRRRAVAATVVTALVLSGALGGCGDDGTDPDRGPSGSTDVGGGGTGTDSETTTTSISTGGGSGGTGTEGNQILPGETTVQTAKQLD